MIPFGLRGTFSILGSDTRPLDDLCVTCRLGPLGDSSSSSLLCVRSTTSPAGRLLPLDEGAGGAEVSDCSLDEHGGVVIMPASPVASLLTEAICGISRISTKSSSSSLLARPLPSFGEASFPGLTDHFPSGSMVTCSTDLGVDFNMSSKYLQASISVRCVFGYRDDRPVHFKMIKVSSFVTYWTSPSWSLFLQL